MLTLKRSLLLFPLVLMLVAFPIYAQESEATAEATAIAESVTETTTEFPAPGLTNGVLIIGVLAVLIVGGAMIMRERSNPTT